MMLIPHFTRRYLLLFLILELVSISGCVSKYYDPILADIEEKRAHQKAIAEQTITGIPQWFTDASATASNMVAGKGTAVSSDLQAAMDHALLNAQVSLAGEINARVSDQIKRLRVAYSNDPDIQEIISTTSDRYIPEVDIGGAHVLKQHIATEDNGFRVYILLVFDKPFTELRKTALQALNKAHEQLMSRNKKYRAKINNEQKEDQYSVSDFFKSNYKPD